MEEEKALIEAILFLEIDPIDLKTLAKISGLSREQVEEVVRELRRTWKPTTADWN